MNRKRLLVGGIVLLAKLKNSNFSIEIPSHVKI